VNPDLLVEFKLLQVQIQDSILRERLMANLTAGFGFLAALLSTLGLYGVMSYLVARRRSEIGIRLAIGADRADVFGLVVRDALFMVAVGLVAGLCASLLLSKYAESLLFQLKGNDPLTLLLGCLLLLGTALAASMLPAYKAASVQPTIALREE
jgi:ABC-type antimicrobial peptide transport system permease subunit